jgi:hypothetical protein
MMLSRKKIPPRDYRSQSCVATHLNMHRVILIHITLATFFPFPFDSVGRHCYVYHIVQISVDVLLARVMQVVSINIQDLDVSFGRYMAVWHTLCSRFSSSHKVRESRIYKPNSLNKGERIWELIIRQEKLLVIWINQRDAK